MEVVSHTSHSLPLEDLKRYNLENFILRIFSQSFFYSLPYPPVTVHVGTTYG